TLLDTFSVASSSVTASPGASFRSLMVTLVERLDNRIVLLNIANDLTADNPSRVAGQAAQTEVTMATFLVTYYGGRAPPPPPPGAHQVGGAISAGVADS